MGLAEWIIDDTCLVDPQGPAGSDHQLQTGCPSIRHKTSKLSENHYRSEGICGLAEWIIDDSCLVLTLTLPSVPFNYVPLPGSSSGQPT